MPHSNHRSALAASFSTTAPRVARDVDGGVARKDLVLVSHKNSVATITMNNPKKLNGWTENMLR